MAHISILGSKRVWTTYSSHHWKGSVQTSTKFDQESGGTLESGTLPALGTLRRSPPLSRDLFATLPTWKWTRIRGPVHPNYTAYSVIASCDPKIIKRMMHDNEHIFWEISGLFRTLPGGVFRAQPERPDTIGPSSWPIAP